MGTPREDQYDNQLIPAADRINGTVPDRRHEDGTPVSVAMEDRTFSKADGAYQNGFLEQAYSKRDGAYTNAVMQDLIALVHRGHEAQGLILEQTRALDGRLSALQGVLEARQEGVLDVEAVAAQIAELLPNNDAEAIIDALARRIAPTEVAK